MKIALCIGNLAARARHVENAYLIGYNHIKEAILDNNEVDVFLHSWEEELKDSLVELYNPKDFLFEDQIDFTSEFSELNSYYHEGNSPRFDYQSLFSMVYSRYRVGKIKSDYEKKNKFTYDWVIFVRYDIYSTSHLDMIYFNRNFDNTYVYMPMYEQLNAGPNDTWFYSNSNNMDDIFLLYEDIKNYYSEDSEYINSLQNDWISSNISDRFSNELLMNREKMQGEKIPLNKIVNGHLIYKWHLYKKNLWSLDKIKFVVTRHNFNHVFKEEPHNNIIRKQIR